ncbi:hypothetical protein GCM10023322_55780 [Rugosimonospora acidiphila]|uniref:Uncharacterized protein n=1 Tax=Rugosimonospora acidiphila TaxID=556531 RepID=A0ABP9SCC4_9ACTN
MEVGGLAVRVTDGVDRGRVGRTASGAVAATGVGSRGNGPEPGSWRGAVVPARVVGRAPAAGGCGGVGRAGRGWPDGAGAGVNPVGAVGSASVGAVAAGYRAAGSANAAVEAVRVAEPDAIDGAPCGSAHSMEDESEDGGIEETGASDGGIADGGVTRPRGADAGVDADRGRAAGVAVPGVAVPGVAVPGLEVPGSGPTGLDPTGAAVRGGVTGTTGIGTAAPAIGCAPENSAIRDSVRTGPEPGGNRSSPSRTLPTPAGAPLVTASRAGRAVAALN